MTDKKVSQFDSASALAYNDIFYGVISGSSQKITLNQIAENSYSALLASTSASATTFQTSSIPNWVKQNGGYVLIDPGTTNCELRRIEASSISGSTLTTSALTYAHTNKTSVLFTDSLVLKPEMFGAIGNDSGSGDGTDCTTAFQRMVTQANSTGSYASGAEILLSGKYHLTGTIEIPIGVNMRGCSRNADIVATGASYTSGYVFRVNAGFNPSFVQSQNVFSNFYFRYVGTTNVKGFYSAGTVKWENIDFRNFYCAITTSSSYDDHIVIDHCYFHDPRDQVYQIQIGNLGDGLVINSCGFEASYAASIQGCTGGLINACVGGYWYFASCDNVTIANMHNEGGAITFYNSSGAVRDSYFWKHLNQAEANNTPIEDYDSVIRLTSNANGRYHVTLDNLKFIYFNTETAPASLVQTEVQINSKYHVTIRDCYRKFAQYGSLPTGELTGILCEDSSGNLLTAFNNYSYQASQSSIIEYDTQKCNFSVTAKNNDTDTLNGGVCSVSSMMSWLLTSGCYYYKVQQLFDLDRMVGATPTYEGSVNLTNGGSCCNLNLSTFGTRSSPGWFRVYRGTQTGSYTAYSQMPLVAGDLLYDSGSYLSGYPWTARGEGTYDSVVWGDFEIDRLGRAIIYRSSSPTVGTWQLADRIWNTSFISSASVAGWICTGSGTPGTWRTITYT